MFETFDIWYDNNLGSEDGRPFVIERLKNDGCAACRVDDGIIYN